MTHIYRLKAEKVRCYEKCRYIMVVVVRPSKEGEDDYDFKLTTSGSGSEDG